MKDLLKKRADLIQAYEDARNGVPIGEDEYYESDAFYEKEIELIERLIIGGGK